MVNTSSNPRSPQRVTAIWTDNELVKRSQPQTLVQQANVNLSGKPPVLEVPVAKSIRTNPSKYQLTP
jgi:hypothetical protein